MAPPPLQEQLLPLGGARLGGSGPARPLPVPLTRWVAADPAAGRLVGARHTARAPRGSCLHLPSAVNRRVSGAGAPTPTAGLRRKRLRCPQPSLIRFPPTPTPPRPVLQRSVSVWSICTVTLAPAADDPWPLPSGGARCPCLPFAWSFQPPGPSSPCHLSTGLQDILAAESHAVPGPGPRNLKRPTWSLSRNWLHIWVPGEF